MTIELSTPSFKPREYEGEYIRYTLYGLDSDGNELDDLITSPKKSTVTHTIKELLPDYGRVYNGMHVVAILYDKNDRMLNSEVVWSTDQSESNGADEDPYTVYSLDNETGRVSKDGVYPTWRKAYAALADGTVWDEGSSNNFVFHGNHLQQIYKYKKTGRTGKWSGNGYDVIFDREISEDPAEYIKGHFTATRYNSCRFNESKGTDETIEYEKGHKNSRGEDAPWVIRDHKGGKVLSSFATKGEAEAHLERMKRYSKSESVSDWDLCILVAHNPLTKDTYYCYDLNGEWTPHEDNAYIFKSRGDAEKAVSKFVGRLQRGHLGGFAAWDPKYVSIEPVKTLKKALHASGGKVKSEVADSAGFSRFVKKLLDIAIDKFNDAAWARLIKGYDFGDDFEKGRSVEDSLKSMQKWVLATEKKMANEKLFSIPELENMAMNDYKAAVKAAWSAAGVKNFKIDNSDGSNKMLDVWPKTLDGNFYDVSWRIMPELGVVVQYADDNTNGNSNIEREIPFKDTDEIEAIFTGEFKTLDDVIEQGKPAKTETAPDEYARNNFLEGALDYAEISDDNGNVALLKFYKNKRSDDFKLDSYDGENQKTLAAGGLRYVVDRYGELLDMDPAEAIIEIAKE